MKALGMVLFLLPAIAAAQEKKLPDDAHLARTLARLVPEEDFGELKFGQCEIGFSKRPGDPAGEIRAKYGEAAGLPMAEVTIHWFQDRKEVREEYNQQRIRTPGFRNHLFEGRAIQMTRAEGAEVYLWSDDRHVVIVMGISPAAPPEMLRAYMDRIPSRLAQTGEEEDPSDEPAEERAKNPLAELRGMEAVAECVLEEDLGDLLFEGCRILGEGRAAAGLPFRAGAMVKYYDPAGGKTEGRFPDWARRIDVTINWFENEESLRDRYAGLGDQIKDAEKVEIGESVVLRMRGPRSADETYFWTDSRKRLVSITAKGIPAVPAEIAKAYLAVVPSKVADMELPADPRPAGK